MLGIGRPDRHALLCVTPHETRCAVTAAPSRVSGFVHRRNLVVRAHLGEGPVCMLCRPLWSCNVNQ